jgi:hypothetical protein
MNCQLPFMNAPQRNRQDETSEYRASAINYCSSEKMSKIILSTCTVCTLYYDDRPCAHRQQLVLLKAQMDGIEDELLAFKRRQRERYGALNEAAKQIEVELPMLLERFESWDREPPVSAAAAAKEAAASKQRPPVQSAKAAAARTKSASNADDSDDGDDDDGDDDDGDNEQDEERAAADADAARLRAHSEHLRSVVARIHDAIASEGGATGGWATHDHDHFLKLRARYGKNAEALAERCAASIPGQSEESAQRHEQWYRRHVQVRSGGWSLTSGMLACQDHW